MSSGRSSLSPRALVFALAAACFFALGIVVYRDDPQGNPGAFTRLSPGARAGFVHWRAQNCLVCHQLYGFGGYLGPDLTHVTQRVDEPAFLEILKKGTGPMPRADLDETAGRELYGFLKEMDRTGQGHPSAASKPLSWGEVFNLVRSDATAPGIEVFNRLECARCHQPLRVGSFGSPDLTRAWERTSRWDLRAILRAGRGSMPVFSMSSADATNVIDLLGALSERRAELLSRQRESRGTLPWWNYVAPPPDVPTNPAGGVDATR